MLKIDDFASFSRVATPFYYYDIDLFRRTVDKVAELSERTGIHVHYSLKANSDRRLNEMISSRTGRIPFRKPVSSDVFLPWPCH